MTRQGLFQRCDGAVPSARQEGEGDQGTVAQFNVGCARHFLQHVQDLLKRRHGPFVCCLCDPALFFRERDIVRIGVGQMGSVTLLASEQ